MSRHATAAVLSAYLDEELEAEELRFLELHLEDCEPCQEQLTGMRSVVTALQGLERQAPSPVLGQSVVRRVHVYGQPKGFMERMETRLEKMRLDSSPFVTFTLVLAFAVILVVFAQSIQWSSEKTRLVVLPSVLPEIQEVELGERIFERKDGVWMVQGLEREATRVVAAGSVEGLEVRAGIEGIDRLLLDRPVVLELETGEIVELRLFEDQSPKREIEDTR